jgi:magnesium-transporting ATPase (P-type)
MYNLLTKKGQLFAFGLGLVIVLIFLGLALSGISEFNLLTEKEDQFQTTIFNFGLWMPMILIAICIITILFFGVMGIASDPKGSMKGLIGFVALILIFVVAYMTSSEEASGRIAELVKRPDFSDVTPGVLKYIGGAISTTGILALIAIVAFGFSELRNLFK